MSEKHTSSVDPDYEIPEAIREHVKMREEIEKNNFMERVRATISKEFQNELELRENQLDLVQQRLNKAAKMLHLLRYCLVTSYYNRNEFNSTEDELIVMDSQNRIHPAVKKLLGNNSANICSVGRKRNRTKLKYFNIKPRKPFESSVQSESCKAETDTNSSESVENTTNNSENEPEAVNPIRNRNLTKHRIVIGNISKWMPSESEEDGSTHKWMVYVRGPKDSPDVSHIIQKVVFYLHPSYKPNDVVEINESPFHLSRRGWGEFPLRIQMYFHCKLNKPVDIIHNLKLDQTYTGRQTLGNETIIELSLYINETQTNGKEICTEDQHLTSSEIKSVYFEDNSVLNQSVEHDYCFNICNEKEVTEVNLVDNQVIEQNDFIVNSITLDHSYCDPSTDVGELTKLNKDMQECEDVLTCDDKRLQEMVNSVSHVTNFETIITSDGKIFMIKRHKRPQQSLLKKSFYKRPKLSIDDRLIQRTDGTFINYSKYKFDFSAQKFRTVSQATSFLLKHLPIINNLATDLDYKCLYPYVAKSLEEFTSWNIGKRLASEWSRARQVRRFLSMSDHFSDKSLTTKKILLYARSHGYTPLANYTVFDRDVDFEFKDGSLKYAPKSGVSSLVVDPPIDVVDCDTDKQKSKSSSNCITLTDKDTEVECSYVKQTALDVGILLKPEEIIPGVLFNSAERTILEAVKCFVENLIRNARSCLVGKGNFRENLSIITGEEVLQALNQRREFSKILSFNKDTLKY